MPSPAHRKKRVEFYKPNSILKKFLLLVLLLLLVSGSFKTYLSWKNRLWREGARFSVVVAEEEPALYSINSQTGKLVVVRFPAKTQVQTSHGYGEWFLGSLWQLGVQEGLGGEILANSLKKTFGIPVDAWIDKEGLRTNLSLFDRARLFRIWRMADRREIDLVSARVLLKHRFPDGVEGYLVVAEQAKVIFEKNLRDDAVFKEGKTVTVVNTTSKAGLAGEVAQLAAVLGARVIGADSKSGEVEDCLIKGEKSELSSVTARRLQRLLGCEVKEGETASAQLEVLLGDGFSEKF